MKTISMEAIASEIDRKFHIQMDIYDIISNTGDVLKKMGMAALKKTTEIFVVENYCVKLPPSAHKVESVVQLDRHIFPTDIVIQEIVHPPSITMEKQFGVSTPTEYDNAELVGYSEGAKPNYLGQVKGVYTDYVWDCPYVKLNFTDYCISVEYIELSQDANGLPLVPEEAFNAAVYYNVYTYMQPVYLTGKIPEHTFQRVESWKDKHINQAKNDRYFKRLSKNEKDKLFDIFTSFDRKRTNLDS